MMNRFVRDYIAALGLVLCAAVAYRFLVVPLIEPPAGRYVEVHVGMQELMAPDLGNVFPAGSWQADNPKFLQAEWGWVLFQQSNQDSPDRWRVSPVSVVLHQKSSGKDGGVGKPIVLNAPEGAVIEFEEPLNMVSGTRPQIKGGQLLGEVQIFNYFEEDESHYQLTNQPHENQFKLVTRNVRIDSRQIRSAEEVTLVVGGSRIVGRDLTIKLASGKGLRPSASGQLSVLDSLELIYLDELTVPLPNGPLWAPKLASNATGLASNLSGADSNSQDGRSTGFVMDENIQSSYSGAKLSVICDGRVVFDFPTFTLRMNQRVELRHHWSDNDYDSFACRSLELKMVDQFDEGTTGDESLVKESPETTGRAVNPVARVSQFLKKLVATGSPIQADIPSLNARMTAGEIEFDAENNRLRMTGGTDTIDVQYANMRLAIPALEYELNPTDPDAIGKLTIAGSGDVKLSEEAIPVRGFSWQTSLQILPQEVGNLLWIVGNVEARMRDGGSVRTDDLLVAFQVVSTPAPTSQNVMLESSTNAAPARNLQVDKLRAKGQVKVDTSELAAQTDVLLIMFEHLAASETPPADAQAMPFSLGPRLNSASGPKKRFWVTDPRSRSSENGNLGGADPIAPVAAPRPTLSGGAITANLVVSKDQIISQDLSVLKNVKVSHELQTKSERLPLVYSGYSLRLITGAGDDRVQIAGSPARIDLGDGFFEGPLVIISGMENRVSIRDHGTFRMPLAMMPDGGNQKMRWLSAPTCNFRGELTFDGQLVEIKDDVRLTGQVAVGESQEIWSIDATAPKLEMMLDRSVQVTKPTDAKAAAIDRLSLVGTSREVLVSATKFGPQGQALGHHVLNNPRLDFYAATGQLLGPGPGWFRSWSPANEDSPMRSIAAPGSLMALHLMYNGGLEGNLMDRQLGFQRGVRVGMSAVPDWSTNIDAAAMSQLKLNQGTVDCDRLQLAVTATRSTQSAAKLPWEIQALGGVAFRMMTERGLVDGTAARAAYDAGNDLFVLEGSPKADAVVRNTSLTGQPLMNVSMLSFTLRPETLEINTLVRGATVSQLPIGQNSGQRP